MVHVGQGAAGREPGSDRSPRSSAGISGNLCRCTGYVKIVEAVRGAPPAHPAGATPQKGGARCRATAQRLQGHRQERAPGGRGRQGARQGPLHGRHRPARHGLREDQAEHAWPTPRIKRIDGREGRVSCPGVLAVITGDECAKPFSVNNYKPTETAAGRGQGRLLRRGRRGRRRRGRGDRRAGARPDRGRVRGTAGAARPARSHGAADDVRIHDWAENNLNYEGKQQFGDVDDTLETSHAGRGEQLLLVLHLLRVPRAPVDRGRLQPRHRPAHRPHLQPASPLPAADHRPHHRPARWRRSG